MRDNKIKPIETYYDGYKFRSRLEARWAVFFNTVKTPYQYELEGFDLGIKWYLPDFFLPELGTWVEIKPLPLPFDEFGDVRENGSVLTIHTQAGPTALAKMLLLKEGLVQGKISRQHFIFYGTPGVPHIVAEGANWHLLSGSLGFSPDNYEGKIFLRAATFALVKGERELAIWPYYMDSAYLPDEERRRNSEHLRFLFANPVMPRGFISSIYQGRGVSYDAPRLKHAYDKARSERFVN